MKVEWPGELSECIDCRLANVAQTHFIEHGRKLGVPLTEYMGQKNGVLDGSIPGGRGERELCLAVASIWHWRQLEEVASHNELDASKRTSVVPNGPGNFLEFIIKVSINHGHFINDENLGAQPAVSCFLVLLNLLIVSIDAFIVK